MEPVDLLIQLRQDLTSVISGVQNANGIIAWDTTTPNSTTKVRLSALLRKYIDAVEQIGVYVVTRVCSCENPSHGEGYLQKNIAGIGCYGEPGNTWTGQQLFQGYRVSMCQCASGNMRTKHWVIDDLVVCGTADKNRHIAFAVALVDIQKAIENCGDKRTRSSIREHLLRALLVINDNIIPQPLDEYIATRLLLSAETQA